MTLTLGTATRFDNGTRKHVAAVELGVDTRRSRADEKSVGGHKPKAVALKRGETTLSLRVLVNCLIVEVFAMGGRGAMVRRMYPKQIISSVVAALIYNLPKSSSKTAEAGGVGEVLEPPLVSVSAWEMESAYV